MLSLVDDEGECISENEFLSFSSNLQRAGCMLVFKTILDVGSFRTSQRVESTKVITSIQNVKYFESIESIENATGMKHIERVESIGSDVRSEKIKDIERITGVRST